jgi:transcriptional regulator with GAF, ATPase, and Fis domain
LQEGQFERVGDEMTRRVDVRLIAATNKDLEQEVISGRFRRDLFYRLSVFPINLPPLRERADDIPSLATHFLKQAAQRYGRHGLRLTKHAIRTLETYTWPGNVRELQHVIDRAVLLSRGSALRLDGVLAPPDEMTRARPAASPRDSIVGVIRESEWRRRERENLRAGLQLAKGRIYGPDGAAEILGVKPTTLISRLKALGLRTPYIRRRSRKA